MYIPWYIALLLLLPPFKTSRHPRLRAQGALWLALGAANCTRGAGGHMCGIDGPVFAIPMRVFQIYNGI